MVQENQMPVGLYTKLLSISYFLKREIKLKWSDYNGGFLSWCFGIPVPFTQGQVSDEINMADDGEHYVFTTTSASLKDFNNYSSKNKLRLPKTVELAAVEIHQLGQNTNEIKNVFKETDIRLKQELFQDAVTRSILFQINSM